MKNKTVETVSDLAVARDHRAEATVLIRSLRGPIIPILKKVEHRAAVKNVESTRSFLRAFVILGQQQ
jgi:hypothetical protein